NDVPKQTAQSIVTTARAELAITTTTDQGKGVVPTQTAQAIVTTLHAEPASPGAAARGHNVLDPVAMPITTTTDQTKDNVPTLASPGGAAMGHNVLDPVAVPITTTNDQGKNDVPKQTAQSIVTTARAELAITTTTDQGKDDVPTHTDTATTTAAQTDPTTFGTPMTLIGDTDPFNALRDIEVILTVPFNRTVASGSPMDAAIHVPLEATAAVTDGASSEASPPCPAPSSHEMTSGTAPDPLSLIDSAFNCVSIGRLCDMSNGIEQLVPGMAQLLGQSSPAAAHAMQANATLPKHAFLRPDFVTAAHDVQAPTTSGFPVNAAVATDPVADMLKAFDIFRTDVVPNQSASSSTILSAANTPCANAPPVLNTGISDAFDWISFVTEDATKPLAQAPASIYQALTPASLAASANTTVAAPLPALHTPSMGMLGNMQHRSTPFVPAQVERPTGVAASLTVLATQQMSVLAGIQRLITTAGPDAGRQVGSSRFSSELNTLFVNQASIIASTQSLINSVNGAVDVQPNAVFSMIQTFPSSTSDGDTTLIANTSCDVTSPEPSGDTSTSESDLSAFKLSKIDHRAPPTSLNIVRATKRTSSAGPAGTSEATSRRRKMRKISSPFGWTASNSRSGPAASIPAPAAKAAARSSASMVALHSAPHADGIEHAALGYLLQEYPHGVGVRRLLTVLGLSAARKTPGSTEHELLDAYKTRYEGRSAAERMIDDASSFINFDVRKAPGEKSKEFDQIYLLDLERPYFKHPQPPRKWNPTTGLTPASLLPVLTPLNI
ncbi:hypothetical protein OC844_007787, partial [Tilletia horrida]